MASTSIIIRILKSIKNGNLLHQFWLGNCTWEEFGHWGSCSKSCGGGQQSRSRRIKQRAAYGGLDCVGEVEEKRECNNAECQGKCVKIIRKEIFHHISLFSSTILMTSSLQILCNLWTTNSLDTRQDQIIRRLSLLYRYGSTKRRYQRG